MLSLMCVSAHMTYYKFCKNQLTSQSITMKLSFRENTWKIHHLVLISGNGNSIFRSIRPGRSKPGSRLSMRFVARTTLTFPRESKPSSWFSSSNLILWISHYPPEWASYLFVPTTSISSMKTIEGKKFISHLLLE
jgi:hypothetical protein